MALLEARSVTLHFGGVCAVSEFDLCIMPHELVGIIGPNGAGKTTVFNIITGVYRPRQGSIILANTELVGMAPHEITALGIARTFQNIRLFKELTVFDNVRIAHYGELRYSPVEALFHCGRFRTEEKRVARRSLEMLAIFGLSGYASDSAKNLPYGLQRRLEIIRALATGPKLLLLDEPAAGMNPNETDELMDFIQRIRKEFNITILLIEHQMRLVMGICERIVVLDFGVTIACGAPHEIQNNPKVLAAYLGEG